MKGGKGREKSMGEQNSRREGGGGGGGVGGGVVHGSQ